MKAPCLIRYAMKVFMTMIASDGYHDDCVDNRGGADGHNEDGDRERDDDGPCRGLLL